MTKPKEGKIKTTTNYKVGLYLKEGFWSSGGSTQYKYTKKQLHYLTQGA